MCNNNTGRGASDLGNNMNDAREEFAPSRKRAAAATEATAVGGVQPSGRALPSLGLGRIDLRRSMFRGPRQPARWVRISVLHWIVPRGQCAVRWLRARGLFWLVVCGLWSLSGRWLAGWRNTVRRGREDWRRPIRLGASLLPHRSLLLCCDNDGASGAWARGRCRSELESAMCSTIRTIAATWSSRLWIERVQGPIIPAGPPPRDCIRCPDPRSPPWKEGGDS